MLGGVSTLFTAVAPAGGSCTADNVRKLNAEEDTAMTNETYKAWLDGMPIDDVRRRIERLEQKLSDLHVLERLYTERQGAGEAPSEPAGGATSEPAGEETWEQGSESS
jgi:hypothetical protein